MLRLSENPVLVALAASIPGKVRAHYGRIAGGRKAAMLRQQQKSIGYLKDGSPIRPLK